MIDKIQISFKRIAGNKDLKKVSGNFIALMILQVLNLLLPVITVPFIIKYIGIEGYGRIAFVQALIFYFIAVVDYGFDLTATKTISENRDDPGTINNIFSAVLYTKLFLGVVCFIFSLLLIGTIGKIQENSSILFIYLGVLLGNILTPTWFFQGMEEMKVITFVNIISKMVFFLAILTFVKSPEDILLVPTFFSFGYIIAALISMSIALIKYKVRLLPPQASEIKHQIISGYRIFLSRVFVNIYSYINVMVLGVFVAYQSVAFYDISSRIVNSLNAVINQLNVALYPYLSRTEKTMAGLLRTSAKITRILVGLALVLFIAINIVAPYLLPVFIREPATPELRLLLLLLSVCLFLNPLGGQYTQLLVLSGNQRYLLKTVFFTCIFSIVSSFVMAYFLQNIGLGISTILVQLFMLSMMIMKIRKFKYDQTMMIQGPGRTGGI